MAEVGEPGIRHAAVLGRPVAHSLSPVLHNAAYRALGLSWHYSALDCGVEELETALAERAGWAGFSLTMPLKRAGLEIAADVSERAAIVGATNTLLPHDAGWRADNTDVDGVLGAIGETSMRPSAVTVLGAGGTAQAVVAAVAELGLGECSVLVRDRSRTAQLQGTAERAGVTLEIGNLTVDARALQADLVVSTLPAGAADTLAAASWRPGQVLLDAVYAPWPTAIAEGAVAAGATVLSGVLMLLHQAMAQVVLMTDRPAPAQAMRAALRGAQPAAGV